MTVNYGGTCKFTAVCAIVNSTPEYERKVTNMGKDVTPPMTREEIREALDEELEQESNGNRTEYIHRQQTVEELRSSGKAMDTKVAITGIRKAVEASEGHKLGSENFVYKESDKARTAEDEKTRTRTLHGSLGARLANRGEYVFELSIAGSTYSEFRKMHHHAPGKSDFMGNVVKNDKRTRLNTEKAKEGQDAGIDAPKIRRLLDKLYGKRIIRNGKRDKYIRRKEVNGKVKYSLPGPASLDSGDKTRSMDALRHDALEFAQQYLTERFNAFGSGTEEAKNINLLLQGHSRGGVAIGEAMQMIQAWVHNTHPEYEHLVKYDLIQLDPVPGFGNMREHGKLDLAEKTVTDKVGTAVRANTRYTENVQSTVFYSMNVNEDIKHNLFFDPQAVTGAKRVILCPMSHSLHLASVDNTQQGGLSKVGFTFAGNGQQYRGSGINDLDDGVYIMDETATLVKVKSPKQLESIMNNAFGEPSGGQKNRRQTIQNVAEKWFEAHPTPMKKRLEIINRSMKDCMECVAAIQEESLLRIPGEAAIEGRMKLASLATKNKLTDADRKLAGECISKMILFEIAVRSQDSVRLTTNFNKLVKKLQSTDEITAFTKGCTPEDLVGFFDRAGEKVFCKNLHIRDNKLKKESSEKVSAPVKSKSAIGK